MRAQTETSLFAFKAHRYVATYGPAQATRCHGADFGNGLVLNARRHGIVACARRSDDVCPGFKPQ